MKEHLQNKWVVAGLIWGLVVILTFWNVKNVDEIIKLKKRYEISRKNKEFIGGNADRIKEIIEKKVASYHLVESVQFGLLLVENNLNTLANRFDLTGMKIEFNKILDEETSSGTIPIDISFIGTLLNATEYLNSFESDYQYIRLKNVLVTFKKDPGATVFEVKLLYKYTIAEKNES